MGLSLVACSLLVSCGNYSAASLAKKSVNSVANLIPRRIPVAEVRPQDLRKMPTGADRALAWDKHLDSRRFVFFRPKNYKPPTLPDTQAMPADGGILPPRRSGQGSSLDGSGKLPAE